MGLEVRIRRHRDIPDAEMAALVALADDWRDTDEERGFAMALRSARQPAGTGTASSSKAVSGLGSDDPRTVGMLSFVPWGRTGASLDVMRRDRTSGNGIVELMVVELMAQGDDFGLTEVSLNFAAFRGSSSRVSA